MRLSLLPLSVAIALASLNGWAQDVHYFMSDDYRCEHEQKMMQMRTEDKGSALAFELYEVYRGGRSPSLGSVEIEKSAIKGGKVIVHDGRGEPIYELSGLDKLPEGDVKLLGYLYGKPRKAEDCEVMTFHPVQAPEPRFAEQLELLAERPPESSSLAKLLKLDADRPPFEWLPALDQQAMNNQLKEGWEAYLPAYFEHMSEQFRDKDLTPEQAKQIEADLEQAWQATGNYSLRSDIEEKLDDLHSYWPIGHRNDSELAKLFAVKSAEKLCSRVATLRDNYWFIHLRKVSGLPVELWTRDYANELMSLAQQCEGDSGQYFSDKIKDNWPDIEAKANAYNTLIAEVDAMLELPPTIDNFREHNWLGFTREQQNNSPIHIWTFDRLEKDVIEPHLLESLPALQADLEKNIAEGEFKLDEYSGFCQSYLDFGYNDDTFRNTLRDACNTAIEKAYPLRLEAVAKAVNDKAAAALDKGEIGLPDLPDYCRKSGEAYGAGHDFIELCNESLAAIAEKAGRAEIDAALEAIEAIPQTVEGYKANGGFALNAPLFDTYYLPSAFSKINETLNAYLNEAEKKVAAMSDKIDRDGAAEISQQASALLASESDEAALAAGRDRIVEPCATLSYGELPQMAQACRDSSRQIDQRIADIQCQNIWAATDFPDELAEKNVRISGYGEMTLKAMLCKAKEVKGIVDSGFFSDDYLLQVTHPGRQDEDDLVVTLSIVEPKEGNILEFENLKFSQGQPDTDALEDKPHDLLRCLFKPHYCMRDK